MTDWDEAKTRLEEQERLMPGESHTQHTRDIRAALQRVEELEQQKTEIIGIVQRWQPTGSPPPVSAQMLVRWICRTLENRAEAAEAKLKEYEARDASR